MALQKKRVVTAHKQVVTFRQHVAPGRAKVSARKMNHDAKEPLLGWRSQKRPELDAELEINPQPEITMQAGGGRLGAKPARCALHVLYLDTSQTTPACRLPTYDAQTSNSERGIFFSLGLLAVGLVVITLSDAVRFAAMPDAYQAGSSAGSMRSVKVEPKHTSTNLMAAHPGASAERARANDTPVPRS